MYIIICDFCKYAVIDNNYAALIADVRVNIDHPSLQAPNSNEEAINKAQEYAAHGGVCECSFWLCVARSL